MGIDGPIRTILNASNASVLLWTLSSGATRLGQITVTALMTEI